MKLPARFTFALAALLVPAALLSAGCGDKPTDVEEGEPLDLGGLIYNVAITRFLNPADTEDQAYLAGMPPPPKNKDYLAVFLTIKNEGDDPLPSAHTYIVTDTIGDTFRPLEVKNDYALGIGTKVGADDMVPSFNTPAANGPIKGSMLLFLIDKSTPDSRPLTMQIQSVLGDGEVKLDL